MSTPRKDTFAETPPKNSQSEEDKKLAQKWKGRLEAAQKNQESVFKDAKRNYEVYYAQMSDDEKASGWHSNVFLPFLPGKARDAKAKLSIIEPRFRVVPADSWKFENGELQFDQEALDASLKISKKLNREYVNYTANGDVPPRVSVDYSETDAIVAGWGLALAPLKTYRKVYRTHKQLKDEAGEDSAYVDMKTTVKKELLRVGTELESLDIFRCFISPFAKSWERPYWFINWKEDTYIGLKKVSDTKGEFRYDLPAGLATAKATGSTENEYSKVRDAALGFSTGDNENDSDESLDTFNIFDCYDEETGEFLTFVEAKIDGLDGDWHLIRRMPNPYFHGLIPIVPFYVKRRPHSPWGESFFAIARDVQFAYSAAYNEFADNAKLSRNTMMLKDKNANVSGYDVEPGGTVEYDSLNGEKPEAWKMADPNPAVLGTQLEYLEKNMENGTTPQYNSGQVNSSMDKTAGTKGGIEILMEAANDKLSEMYRNLKGSLTRYGYIALRNAQQYQNYIEVLDNPDMSARGQAAMKQGEKVNADFVTPKDLQNAFDVDIDDESLLPLTKSERRQMTIDFVKLMIELQKASATQVELFNTPEDLLRLDWPDITRELGASFGELNAPAFIKKSFTQKDIAKKKVNDAKIEQEATDKAASVAQKNNPEAEVKQEPNGITVQRQKRELSNFKDYPADVKNAVLASLGYPPSQLIGEQAKAQLAKAQGEQLDMQVKQEMVDAAKNGQIDPAELAKFITK